MFCSENSFSCSVVVTETILTMVTRNLSQPVFSKAGARKFHRLCSATEGYNAGICDSWICPTSGLRRQMREEKVDCMSQEQSLSCVEMFVIEVMLLLSW